MATPCSAPSGQGRPRLEVADIFRAAGEAYRDKCVPTLETTQSDGGDRALPAPPLWAGTWTSAPNCGHQAPAYNSCRNRHCPKCQSLAQARWIDQRRQRIVPTKYFHVVFHAARRVARPGPRKSQRTMYNLVLESAARTLLDFGRNRLHAQLG